MQQPRKDFSNKTSPELISSTNKVINAIEELSQQYKNFYLGGFSQGAMVSANAFLSSKGLPISKLILLSGARVNLEEWKVNLPNTPAIPLFVSHGKYDDVLPFKFGEGLFSFLNQHLNGQFIPFNDGHTIPLEVIGSLNAWLTAKK